MSSISCFVWFVGMASLTAFSAWLVMWAMKNIHDEFNREGVVILGTVFGVFSFILAIVSLAGAVG
jgi:hypothetical protein